MWAEELYSPVATKNVLRLPISEFPPFGFLLSRLFFVAVESPFFLICVEAAMFWYAGSDPACFDNPFQAHWKAPRNCSVISSNVWSEILWKASSIFLHEGYGALRLPFSIPRFHFLVQDGWCCRLILYFSTEMYFVLCDLVLVARLDGYAVNVYALPACLLYARATIGVIVIRVCSSRDETCLYPFDYNNVIGL